MIFIKVVDDCVTIFDSENQITKLKPYSLDDDTSVRELKCVTHRRRGETNFNIVSNGLKEKTSPIKLGLTYKGTDTTSEQSLKVISRYSCHPALVDMYSTREGRMYRAMTTHVELGYTIRDFEEDQFHLSQLKENGFVEFNGELEELEVDYII